MSERYYCLNCGTTALALREKQLDAVNRLLDGETITIVSKVEQATCSWTRVWSGKGYGPDADYLCDDCLKGVVDQKSSDWKNVPSNQCYDDVYITDVFQINKEFLAGRADLNRTELILLNSKVRKVSAVCPVCGSKMEDLFCKSMVRDILEPDKKKCWSAAEEYVAQTKKSISYPVSSVNKSTVDIKQYLNHLIKIETNIYYLSERLKELMALQKDSGRNALKEERGTVRIAQESVDEKIASAKKEQSEISSRYAALSLDMNPAEFGLFEPQRPELKKPGLFNKKKVEEENAALTRNYEEKYAAYIEKWKTTQQTELENRKAKNEEIARQRVAEETRVAELITSLQAEKDKIAVDDLDSSIQQINTFYLSEIQEVKDKIVELCDARAKMHSLGVVYPKYLDFIAITTMSEYFETGRCSTLDGPDGAYNLYESEIRANRVIAQLDKVIESLETIKDNQYRAYMVLSQISNDVSDISKKMTSAVDSLSRIATNSDSIRENTEQIAYNTEKTSHYAKINAELTNALGYMVAFK